MEEEKVAVESKENEKEFSKFRESLKNLANMSFVDLVENIAKTYWSDFRKFIKK